MEFFARFVALLEQSYPTAATDFNFRDRLSPSLISPTVLDLPVGISDQAERIVAAFFALRERKELERALSSLKPEFNDPGNFSVLMSYDFHIDKNGLLRLIEINTNASLSLIADLLYDVHSIENRFCKNFPREILDSFDNEVRLANKLAPTPLAVDARHIAIVDEAPESQRLYSEFLLYRDLFVREGHRVSIVDPSAIDLNRDSSVQVSGIKLDQIYNRHTDFYLESLACRAMAQAFRHHSVCLSPNPYEYRLLADKERLVEFATANALSELNGFTLTDGDRQAIEQTLIRTVAVSSFSDPQELWSERKNWFFKPARSFGGKAAYRGSSVARPVFAKIIAGEYLAQQYVPAPTISFPEHGEFKYDLRFYAYRNRIQLACARLYRGQMTNSQTPGGGIAPIRWV